MRGRRPRPLTLADADTPVLRAVARSRRLAWFQVQHARIVLAVAAGEPTRAIASRLECDRATVWRVCRRYEQGGLTRLLLDDPRVGRPQEISPPAAGPDRRTGLPGADRRGAAHHPLDQRGPGPPGRRRRHRGGHQPSAPSGGSCTTWTCNRTAPATGGPPASTPSSRSGPRKSFGATGMRSDWPAEGIWTVAVDEMPNLQVLERSPIRRAIPGSSSSRSSSTPATGRSTCCCSWSSTRARWRSPWRRRRTPSTTSGSCGPSAGGIGGLKGVFLIQDGDPSHTSGDTAAYWSGCRGWWRPRFTPAHASWLNQAELLVGAFGYHYLKRGSWASREEFIEHVLASGPEYNRPLRPPL